MRPRSRGKKDADESTFTLTNMPRSPPSSRFMQTRDNSDDLRIAENYSTKFSGKAKSNVASIRPYTAPTPSDGDRVEPWTTKDLSNAHPEIKRSVLYEVVHAHQHYRAPQHRAAAEGVDNVIDKSLAHEVLRTMTGQDGIDLKDLTKPGKHGRTVWWLTVVSDFFDREVPPPRRPFSGVGRRVPAAFETRDRQGIITRVDMLRWLLQVPGLLESIDDAADDGTTPLWNAQWLNHTESTRFFLQHVKHRKDGGYSKSDNCWEVHHGQEGDGFVEHGNGY